jgi:hypothetical protein
MSAPASKCVFSTRKHPECRHPKRKRAELIIGATVYARCSWCFAVLSERGLYEHDEAMTVYTTTRPVTPLEVMQQVSTNPSPFPAPQ